MSEVSSCPESHRQVRQNQIRTAAAACGAAPTIHILFSSDTSEENTGYDILSLEILHLYVFQGFYQKRKEANVPVERLSCAKIDF
jgi:hypothetical protein